MGGRVLIIEDNLDNRELMAYLLRACGHATILAESGPAGIEKARAEPPDVILLDLHMPGMDGYEVAGVLKSDPELGRIPLVAVTAVAMVGDREATLRRGFDGYLSKPITPETFSEEVATYLPQAAGPARQPQSV